MYGKDCDTNFDSYEDYRTRMGFTRDGGPDGEYSADPGAGVVDLTLRGYVYCNADH